MRAFNSRAQLRRLHSRAGKRALVSQPCFVTSSLSSYILLQLLLLFSADGFQRAIVKNGVKRLARRVQLLHDSDI